MADGAAARTVGAVVAEGSPPSPPSKAARGPTARSFGSVLSDYVQISKPRILLLLLMVAWAAMFVAAGGVPGWKPFLAVTLGGTFSTAASGALNNVLERRRDARMGRTANRPVASGRITPLAATVYGLTMAMLAVLVLVLPGYTLAAAFTAAAIAYYVLVYTVALKPATPHNIVIGGLAGSFPALIGWTAATGTLAWPASLPAIVLAALVFLWTPAHFWSLALLYKDDYAAAEYPMMPNVHGDGSTRVQIFAYAWMTALASLVLVASRDAGLVYLATAVILGGMLVLRSWRLLARFDPKAYRSFFLFTIQYLGFLLLGLMADRLLLDRMPALPF
ncbi:MAG TPA: heme o synthase [Candidatus Thermoplasmatota archaeon]|nr:heme o synthase [Candidatus Thermoplasmatota archaeon]